MRPVGTLMSRSRRDWRNELRVWSLDGYIARSMKVASRLFILAGISLALWFGCDSAVIEPEEETPLLSAPWTSFDDRDDRFYAGIRVTLPSVSTNLDSIWTEMYLATGTLADSLGTDTLMTSAPLADAGTGGDILPVDGFYATKFASPLPDSTGGSVRFEFYAIVAGDTSNESHVLRLENLRPIILSISAAAILSLPTDSLFNLDTVRATVFDADGLDDIRTVQFTSLKPDSTLANNGQPISLADNGDVIGWGDLVKDDGIYSRIIAMDSTALAGAYIYKFVAKDFGGGVSDTVTHTVIVQ